jgi:transcriptional regulator with XRE-family HTH domain
LRQRRIRRRWSQEELAHISELSVRLIAKAEAGGSLHPKTIDRLSAALSEPAAPLFPEDLISSPRALVDRFVETYRRHEHELAVRCRDFLADELVCIVGSDDSSVPLAGTYGGPDGFDCYCRNFFEIFERCDKDLYRPTIIAEGNHVMVAGREAIRLKGFPKEPEEPAGWLVLDMRFSRGKLIRLEFMFDMTGFGIALTRWQEFKRANEA